MMDREKQLKLLKKYISGDRLKHSLSVEKTAVKLARKFDEDEKKAAAAGLLHDIAKDLTKSERNALIKKYELTLSPIEEASPELLHGKLGALILAENEITNKKVLSAVEHHTMGVDNMSKLDKIVYLADLIEPKRNFSGVKKLRFYAARDLDIALFESMKASILRVLKNEKPVHPKTIDAYNHLLINHINKSQF